MRRDLTSANSLKLEYLPLERKGCANISSVRLGVKVMLTLVSIESVLCSSRPNTYRVPANCGATVGSLTAVTYCCAVLSRSSEGERVTRILDDGFSVRDR